MILCMAAVKDYRERRIPNLYPFLLLAAGAVQSMIQVTPDIQNRVAGAVIVSGIMLFLSMLRPGAFGGGDMKLVAAGGFALGLESLLRAVLISLWGAGLYSIYLIGIKKLPRKTTFALGPFLSLGMIYVIWT